MLNSKQRAYLRSQANDLQPIVQIGKNGINDSLIAQILDALEAHELIKITVHETAFMTTREACDIICEKTKSDPVQCIGFKFVIYKRASKEKNQKILLAAAKGGVTKKKTQVKPGEKAKKIELKKKLEAKRRKEMIKNKYKQRFKKSASQNRDKTSPGRKGSSR